jgi:hypothetical protein
VATCTDKKKVKDLELRVIQLKESALLDFGRKFKSLFMNMCMQIHVL